MKDRYLGMDFSDLSFVEEQKLKGFFHKFTEEYYTEYKIGHIIFAAYAAVPTYINPDLLYKIWMNFKEYFWRDTKEQIHLVAVVDLINSSFCEEIGPKLYKINGAIKKVLNDWLENEFESKAKKIVSEKDIAHFINAELKHYQKDYNLWGGKDYVFDQSLNADLLVYPERALEKIKKVLYHAESDTEKLLAFNLLVDAKKKISTEINFDEISELGQGWKEYLLGKPTKLLKKLEGLENSLLKDQPESPYNMEIKIPVEIVKEETAQKKKKKIYGVFVGIDEYEESGIFNSEGCVKDATAIHDLLKTNIDNKKNKIDFKLFVNEKATYKNVMDCSDELEDLDNGDTFFLYYSGYADDGGFMNTKGRNFLFHDSRFLPAKSGRDVVHNLYENDLLDKIYEVIKEKSVHFVFILDCYAATKSENILRDKDDLKGDLIILDAAVLSHNTMIAALENPSYEANERFTASLLDVLQEGGLHMSYNEVYEKLKLNVLQQKTSGRKEYIPKIEAFPPDTLHHKFLNNTENLYDNLEIYYNEKRNQWEVNAGFNKGINSSIPLMPTILEADIEGKKEKWYVRESYLNYASLIDKKIDNKNKFKAKLLQNSLKKILFFMDDKERFDERIKNELRGYLKRRDAPLVEITEDKLDAKYVISHNDVLGYFAYNPLYGETLSMINVEKNIEEFVTHLEYLAQWEGLLQYSNLNSKLNPRNFKWSFLLNYEEGVQQLFNLTNIDIHIKKKYDRKSFKKQEYKRNEDLEIKLIITSKDSSSNKELKKEFSLGEMNGQHPEISFELFAGLEDSNFGFSMLVLDDNLSIEEVNTYYVYKDNQAIRSINYEYINTVRSKLKESKQLYLKIFLSNQPLNYRPFLQEGTNKDIQSKRSTSSEQEIFDASAVDWISYTIPINISLDEGRDELKTEQVKGSSRIDLDDEIKIAEESQDFTKNSEDGTVEEKNAISRVRELVAKGRLRKGIRKLREHLLKEERGDRLETLLHISSQFETLESRRNLKGTASEDEYSVEMGRITESILSLLRELENE